MVQDNGWVVADYPACSPGLNPIEHTWAYMKRQLHKRFPHLMNMPGEPEEKCVMDDTSPLW